MGAALAHLHQHHGTQLRLGVSATPENSHLRLSDDSTLETDLVILGVGVAPNVDWLEGSGLKLDNGVVVDASLRTAHPDVFAVGDVANWPNRLFGRRQRVEHWTNAAEQARHAARNIVQGTNEPYLGSNYFWSDQYGNRIQFVGSSAADEAILIDGSMEERQFLAWYRKGNQLVGALGIGSAKLVMLSKRLIEARTSWVDARRALDITE
jgi:NADPH-dependent 2,4-dienoyl-CoA reductase/sulfur reductase-like enzyme